MDAINTYINTCVHIAMYSYYFLSSFKKISQFTKFIKPFLTAFQIIQLLVIVGHCIVAISPSCNASKLHFLAIINVVILISLFLRFYFLNYLKKTD